MTAVLAMTALALSALIAPNSRGRPRIRRLHRDEQATLRATSERESDMDTLAIAANWDLLAACLRAGLPVAGAVRAVACGMSGTASAALRRASELIALGADPEEAWRPALECKATAPLARAARRTARSGSALADTVAALAVTLRERAGDEAESRAERAGVLVTAPLGLCFLPAFICVGVVPVVIGLASGIHIFT